MTTRVQCKNDPKCNCKYHESIHEAGRGRQWLSARHAGRQAEAEAEAG